MAKAKAPAQEQLDRLDSIFGPSYFEHGRLVITVARDIMGIMKVAHKLQSKVVEHLGAVVEVFMEHVKHEWWTKLHEATSTMGLNKGDEVTEYQVVAIPEGIRVHPYKRDHLPTFEVLLLWEDVNSGATKGHCLFTMAHPEVPQLDKVDEIFVGIQSFFAKRWLHVELSLAPPIKGEFELELDGDADSQSHDPYVGGGVNITVLACHPYGFARQQAAEGVAHVTECQPMIFKGISDSAGVAKLCFLPAQINKIQVHETGRFHGTEVVLPSQKLRGLHEGPTSVKVELTPKALANITVHVFAKPRVMPAALETDGIIDWASEEREYLPEASVMVTPEKDGADTFQLQYVNGSGDAFKSEGAEGYTSFIAAAPGFISEERTVMLLIGENEFFVPLVRNR